MWFAFPISRPLIAGRPGRCEFRKSLLDLHCWDSDPHCPTWFCALFLLLHWHVPPVSCAELAPCLAKTAASVEHSLATMAFGNSSARKGAKGALATTTATCRATCRTLQGGYQVTLQHYIGGSIGRMCVGTGHIGLSAAC